MIKKVDLSNADRYILKKIDCIEADICILRKYVNLLLDACNELSSYVNYKIEEEYKNGMVKK